MWITGLGVFSNYYRDGFAFDGMVPSDTTDVEFNFTRKKPAVEVHIGGHAVKMETKIGADL